MMIKGNYPMKDIKTDKGGSVILPKKMLIRISAVIIGIMLICVIIARIGVGAYYHNKYKDYVSVTAVISDANVVRGDAEVHFYATFEYTYHDIQYRETILVSGSFEHLIGTQYTVHIDPEAPNELESEARVEQAKNTASAFSIIAGGCLAFAFAAVEHNIRKKAASPL